MSTPDINFPSVEEFTSFNNGKGFDYIIVGAGTAGLALAARLSEDPNVTVGVLEAGGYFPDEPTINIPAFFGRSLANPQFDWAFLTAPQAHVNDRQIFHPRGKIVGGSSGLNFMAVGRGTKEEYDAFGTVGNKGWSWLDLLKYFKKCETLTPADPEYTKKFNASIDPEFHGTDGPIQTSFNPFVSDLTVPYNLAIEEATKGVMKPVHDASAGKNVGTYNTLAHVDRKTGKRSYSANAYFVPNASRSNLVLLTHAHVTKLELIGDGEPYTVSSVHFQHVPPPAPTKPKETPGEYPNPGAEAAAEAQAAPGGDPSKVYEIVANKEVILCAGAFQSPQILELSGIGGKEVLQAAGIEQKVDLPGVGENLQDHIYISTTYEVDNKVATFDLMRNEAYAAEQQTLYDTEKTGQLASVNASLSFLPLNGVVPPARIAELKETLKNDSALHRSPAAIKQEALLSEWFDDDNQAQLEFIAFPGFFPAPGKTPKPGAHYSSMLVALMHPHSRGSVHVTPTPSPTYPSTPFSHPSLSIDFKYFSSPVDLELLVHGVRLTKLVHESKGLKDVTKAWVEPAWAGEPGSEKQDADGGISDEDLEEYVKRGIEPVYHPACSAAMFPRADEGVVDERLKVYGVSNLRVCDASILPFHIAAHPVMTIFAIAEKAADLIKEDAKAPVNA